MPSSGAPDRLPEAPIVAAARLVAERSVYGLVWLDDDLVATARYGCLVDFVEIGSPVAASMPAMIGLEDEIAALKENPESFLNLPAVTIMTGEDQPPKLNILVLRSVNEKAYLIVVSRAITKADLESELSGQIRARLMAEAALQKKSTELARANRDLEEFAAIISHDLKSPLRAIRYITEDLQRNIEAPASGIAHELIQQVHDQSLRMSRMLTALLDYSSIGRKEQALKAVDTLALVKSILGSLPHPTGLRVELHGEWPVIETLEAPLDLVLRNLVANAFAHHDQPQGVVRISALHGNNDLEIVVADDGPGIPIEHQEAIFLPFRTLKASSGTSGQGMGLSLVKRTIEAVKGRIEVDSDPTLQRGAAFRVIWPKSIRD